MRIWGKKTSNLPEGRENTTDLLGFVLVLHLIGWVGGESFLDQSQSEIKQIQSNPGSLLRLNWKLLLY